MVICRHLANEAGFDVEGSERLSYCNTHKLVLRIQVPWSDLFGFSGLVGRKGVGKPA